MRHREFVNDTEDVQVIDGTSILGGLTLGVVEVSRDSNDWVGDVSTKVRLSGLPHLGQNHWRGFPEGLEVELEMRSRSVKK